MQELVAEEILKRLHDKNQNISSLIDKNDINAILYELDVFEAELLAQNEELMEKDKELRDSKEEYEQLFNKAPIVYVVLDKEYKVKKYNTLADYYFLFSRSKKQHLSFISYIKADYFKKLLDFVDDKDLHNISINIQFNVHRNNTIVHHWFKVT